MKILTRLTVKKYVNGLRRRVKGKIFFSYGYNYSSRVVSFRAQCLYVAMRILAMKKEYAMTLLTVDGTHRQYSFEKLGV